MSKWILSILLIWPVIAVAGPEEWTNTYVVIREGTPIGTHRVDVTRDGDVTKAHVTIALDVSLGFIPLYSYRHESDEVWHNNRLESLSSRTDDNGDKTFVTAKAKDNSLEVHSTSGDFIAPADTVPTSYWNNALVANRPLLDSQLGRLLDIQRVPMGNGRWRLQGDLMIDISYAPNGKWSGLSFHHKGADFVYQPQYLVNNNK
jgi:hypothetical protein